MKCDTCREHVATKGCESCAGDFCRVCYPDHVCAEPAEAAADIVDEIDWHDPECICARHVERKAAFHLAGGDGE